MKKAAIITIIAISAAVLGIFLYALKYPCSQTPYPKVLSPVISRLCGNSSGKNIEQNSGQKTTTNQNTFQSSTLTQYYERLNNGSSSIKFGVVVREKIENFFVDKENNITAVKPNGEIIKITKDGISNITNSPINEFISSKFSFNGDKILIKFGNPKNPSFSIFDTKTNLWSPLDQKIQNPAWSPDSNKLAYFEQKNGSSIIKVLDADKLSKNALYILKIHQKNLIINWIKRNQLILSPPPSSKILSPVLLADISKKTITPLYIFNDSPGAILKWDNDANLGLFFESTDHKGGSISLWMPGQKTKEINFLTLPSKCSFYISPIKTDSARSEKYLICAVPRDQDKFSKAVLPDDYLKENIFTEDNIIQINTESGHVDAVFNNPSEHIDAISLKIKNNILFFINKFNNWLYAASL